MKTQSTAFCLFLLFSITISVTAKAQANVQDSLALVDLYKSTNGPLWTHHDNWLTGPVKNWYGIGLSGNGRVTSIDLTKNHLKGRIPATLGGLSYLETLYLDLNRLSGSIPPELGNLSSLLYLKLTGNELSGNIPPELGKLSNLKLLYLHSNQLSGSIPPELGNLSSLVYLILFGNQLSGHIPPELGKLSNLAMLDFGFNQLSGNIPAGFGNLFNLTDLSLTNNRLSGNIPPEIGNLSNLLYVLLDRNKLNGPVPSFSNNLNLESIDLSHNRFTFDGMEPIVQTFPFARYSNQARLKVHVHSNALSVSAGGTLANNTYIWYKKGQPGYTKITGDSVFYPSEPGVYAVRVRNKIATDLNLFSDTITYAVPVALSALSANSKPGFSNSSFTVYPNPAKNILHVQTNGAASFSLLDYAGKMIITETVNSTGSINISGVPAGIYYLRNNNINATKKIFVVK